MRLFAKLLRKRAAWVLLTLLLLLGTVSLLAWRPAWTFPPPRGAGEGGVWDTVVVGSEPEGVAAAVAAARGGGRVLLLSEDERLGGLFVLGEMNSLDLRTRPFNYQRGVFASWWRLVGRGHSFDVRRAERAFARLLMGARVTVRLGERSIEPVMEGGRVTGVSVAGAVLPAKQVIDATAEMEFAAAAGAPFTLGFSSLGLEGRMADTLVFRIDGVEWRRLRRGVAERGPGYASSSRWVVWGHFGGYPAAYQAVEDGVRLRGLNLGRQEDGSLLANALLIYGVDPFDPASRAEGRARALREAPRIVEYLARELPGFERARFAGAAERLYVRESRHLEAECILSADDVLDNRVTPWDIAAGGYPLDVQTLAPTDDGYVFGAPEIYGVPLCVAVPRGVSGLWVVGKAAGYDPITASSARVVPLGMAVAEGVGVAAARAAAAGLTPAELVTDRASVEAVRRELRRRGALLPQVKERARSGPEGHPAYEAYRLLLSRGLAVGGYDNEPRLEDGATAMSYLYLLSNVAARFHNDSSLGRTLLGRFSGLSGPLTEELARDLTREALTELHAEPPGVRLEDALARLPRAAGRNGAPLTRGEAYILAAAVASGAPAAHPAP